MNCIIYVRVSSDEQVKEGFSIAGQRERLKAFALSQGWEIKHEYIEEGWSAKNTERPQLKKLLKDIEKGNIDIVLVYRLDRLTRSVLDLYKLLQTFEDNGAAFKSATEVYDTSTAMGRLFLTLVAALAEWERQNLGERVRFGISQMLDEGKRPGTSSNYGYKFDKNFNCEVIEVEAEVIRLMFEWYLQGFGYVAIADKLNAMGYKPKKAKQWGSGTIKKYLGNSIYKGVYTWGERTFEDNHTAIIDEQTFDKVQSVKEKRTPADIRHGKFLLTGLLRCGNCNHAMSGNTNSRHYDQKRYRCTKCNVSVYEYKILDPLLNELEKLISNKDYFISRMDEAENNDSDYSEIKIELDKISNRKNKLLDLYTDDEAPINKNELYEKIKKLNSLEQELKMKIGELNIDTETPGQKYEKIKSLKNIKEVFSRSDLETQKRLLNSIFESVTINKPKFLSRKADIPMVYSLK